MTSFLLARGSRGFLLTFHLVHEIIDVPCKFFLPGSMYVNVLKRLIVGFLEVLELGLQARDFLLVLR
jgi:hypothetical protein